MTGCRALLARIDWALAVAGPSPAGRVLLVKLARLADDDGSVVVAKAELAVTTNLGITSIKRQLAELVALSLIARQPQGRFGGRQASNRYTLALPTHCVSGSVQGSKTGDQSGPLEGDSQDQTGPQNFPPKNISNPSSSSNNSNSSPSSSSSAVSVDDLTKQARVIARLPSARSDRNAAKWDTDRAEVEGWLRAGALPDRILAVLTDCQHRWGDRTSSLKRFDADVRRDVLALPSSPNATVDLAQAMAPDNQRAICRLLKDGAFRWDEERERAFGPAPGKPGCRFDRSVLAEFNFDHREAA